MQRKSLFRIVVAFLILLAVNQIPRFIKTRVDLTSDNRYTLSDPTKDLIDRIDSPLIIDVLLNGDLPPEFARLQVEVAQYIDLLQDENRNIKVDFVDPLQGSEDREGLIAELQARGLTPTNVTMQDEGKVSQEIVFPWAMATYKNATVRVPLMVNKLGSSTEDRINASVQQLEYAFSDAITKLSLEEKKRIAVIKGNGELEDIYMADFLTALRDYYNLGVVTLDSVPADPEGTLKSLQQFDLALIAKPTESFTDQEKLILDQFIVGGGRSVWLLDGVQMELDSLFNQNGSSIALPNDLNINDMLFRYGIRLNPDLINDMYCTQIVLASGEGASSQYNPLPWVYHPMIFTSDVHPVTENVEALRLQFVSSLDTVASPLKKTILLHSSPLSRAEGVPKSISLDILGQQPDPSKYSGGIIPIAILLEGSVSSAFANRVKPMALENFSTSGPDNKILVISDGDLIKNQLNQGRPLELGYDKWTNNFYGNKAFLLNAVNYMLDDKGLVSLRSREIAITLLDLEKVSAQKTKWQWINLGAPILLLAVFGFFFMMWRKRKYGQ